ncbi:hypothetical protein AFLA_004349 [Aspergillus flavus NRRL3357]|nr:hypothetical protein AFLA_004349 [Aspergillus flavus NRRL3357]
MDTENLASYNRSDGQAVEEPVYTGNVGTFMIASQKEEVLGILELIAQQKENCLQALLAPIHVVTQKEVIRRRGKSTHFEQSDQLPSRSTDGASSRRVIMSSRSIDLRAPIPIPGDEDVSFREWIRQLSVKIPSVQHQWEAHPTRGRPRHSAASHLHPYVLVSGCSTKWEREVDQGHRVEKQSHWPQETGHSNRIEPRRDRRDSFVSEREKDGARCLPSSEVDN